VADKDRAAREAALVAAAKRAAAERLRQAPLNPPAARTPTRAAAAQAPLSAEERLARLMEAEREVRLQRTARTKRNAAIVLFVLVVPILLWLLLNLLRR
jgi:hypothetical protein